MQRFATYKTVKQQFDMRVRTMVNNPDDSRRLSQDEVKGFVKEILMQERFAMFSALRTSVDLEAHGHEPATRTADLFASTSSTIESAAAAAEEVVGMFSRGTPITAITPITTI